MEQHDNPVFEITIDNIEDVYNKVIANELVFIKDGSDDLTRAMKSMENFIFLTDSAKLYYLNAKRGTAVYNSIVNDTRLKNLQISLYNDRNHKDLFELLKDILTVHPNLRILEIKTAHDGSGLRETFTEDNCALLCEGLKRTSTLKELIINDTGEIKDKMSQMLADAINENSSLNSLKICVPLNVKQTLLKSLKKNSRIQSLEIECTNKSNSALNAPQLKEIFEENTTIKTLALRDLNYTDEDVDPLMTFLQTTSSLQTLEFPLFNYQLEEYLEDDREIRYREQVLPRFMQSLNRPLTPIRTLKLSYLMTDDINAVLRALIDNSSLTNLQLGQIVLNDDPFDPEFYGYLSIDENTIEIWNELLTKNKVLKEISLNGVVCKKEDLSRFGNFSVDWFKHNKTLTKLDLRANNLVGVLLGDALSHNKTLKSLRCSHHFISVDLWQTLLTNKTLTELDISDFYVDGNNNTSLFLQRNTTVQKLVSALNFYEGDQFLELLARNTNITSFYNERPALGLPLEFSGQKIALLKDNWILTDLDLTTNWYKALYEPILIRNRRFKLAITMVMHNIARQKPLFPMEIWRLIFRHLTPDISILI